LAPAVILHLYVEIYAADQRKRDGGSGITTSVGASKFIGLANLAELLFDASWWSSVLKTLVLHGA